jgi:DNA-binding transcriptional ArsR family regulator
MVRPLAVRRHNEIVQRLRAAGSVSVGELADVFGVSHETIRRDLKLLADQGHLDVVHGGAARRGMMEPSIAQRGGENAEGKAAIARAAARLVQDAASVLLDSGTTTGALTYELVGRPGLTIFTNSLNHALTLCRVSGNRVVMLGGEIDNNDEATFGTGTSDRDRERARRRRIHRLRRLRRGRQHDRLFDHRRRDARQDDPVRPRLPAGGPDQVHAPHAVPRAQHEQMLGRHRRPHARAAARISVDRHGLGNHRGEMISKIDW